MGIKYIDGSLHLTDSNDLYKDNSSKGLFASLDDVDQTLIDIVERVTTTESNITSLQQALQTTNTQVDKNKEDIAFTQDYVTGVEESVTANTNNITTIYELCATYATKDELSSTEDYIIETDMAFDSRLTSVEETATQNAIDIEELKKNIGNSTTIESLETSVTELTNDVQRIDETKQTEEQVNTLIQTAEINVNNLAQTSGDTLTLECGEAIENR